MSFRARRSYSWIGAPVAFAMAWLACASMARAQPELPVLAQILELNRKAINDYDNLNFDEARADPPDQPAGECPSVWTHWLEGH